MYDIAIIGAGAAGLTAAIFARRTAPEARIVLIDGAPKIGAKILISGGGRCNVTHDVVTPDDFNGNRNAIAKVLRTFTVAQTIEWFAEMGVELKREETGKLFPTTDRARTVLDALIGAADVDVHLSTKVSTIGTPASRRLSGERLAPVPLPPPGDGGETPPAQPARTPAFQINEIETRLVILATGGRSIPKTGSDGSGYALARSLGHTVGNVFPALVPLILEDGHWMTALSGTSLDAELSVRAGSGKVLVRHRGSLLFTHFGLSGPVVLDISRHWIATRGQLVANFLPGETFESLEALLMRGNPRSTIASLLRGRVPERLLNAIAGEPVPLAKLTKDERRRIVRAFVEAPVPVVRDRGFDFAEVTADGVPLSEIDLATMASRQCEGLYLCGEILDVDGRIGGYNFQWAWASGRLAGIHAAREATRLLPRSDRP